MDERLLRKLANREHGVVPSPGNCDVIQSPANPRKTLDIAVIHLHRFAFNSWLRWSTEGWTKSLPTDRSAPDLVTIDYHDDVGADADCIRDELSLLVGNLEFENVDDEDDRQDVMRRRHRAQSNVATYAMLGLSALNDGHIRPAQHLNAL